MFINLESRSTEHSEPYVFGGRGRPRRDPCRTKRSPFFLVGYHGSTYQLLAAYLYYPCPGRSLVEKISKMEWSNFFVELESRSKEHSEPYVFGGRWRPRRDPCRIEDGSAKTFGKIESVNKAFLLWCWHRLKIFF